MEGLWVFKSEGLIDGLAMMLSVVRAKFELNSKAGLIDDNLFAEDFVGGVLNSLFDWDLVNVNKKKTNHPCIDLLDESRGIGVQVTAEVGVRKINETIECTIKHELNLQRLIVFTLVPRQRTYKVSQKEIFDHKKDVLDFGFVIKQAGMLPLDKVQDLLNFVDDCLNLTGQFKSDAVDAEIIRVLESLGRNKDSEPLSHEVLNMIKTDKKHVALRILDVHANELLKASASKLYEVAYLYTLLAPLKAEVYFKIAQGLYPEDLSSINVRGLNLMRLGLLTEAEATFKSGLEKEGVAERELSGIYGNLGILNKSRSQFKDAIQCYQKAIALTSERDAEVLARHYNNLGVCFCHLENFNRAAENFSIAINFLDLAVAADDAGAAEGRFNLIRSNILTNKAVRCRQLAKLKNSPALLREAESFLLQAIKLAGVESAKTELMKNYGNLSNVYLDMDNFPRAKSFLLLSYDLAVETHDYLGEITCLINLGRLYILMDCISQALQHLLDAASKAQNRYPRLLALAQSNLAILYKKTGDSLESSKNYKLAVGFYESYNLEKSIVDLERELAATEMV
ncbi:hypothetical protein ALP52_03455 [Pseudomonas amygdali pv. mori]|uniref:SMEK domain-containing protein n=1 Tax=Pseudomonas amygdali pv. mori TaxID=34065 RepID=A0A3M5J0L3_PSEA0|nr:hypothetical protein ALP52_03455 [Pseudomonas amygdali pv. mori]